MAFVCYAAARHLPRLINLRDREAARRLPVLLSVLQRCSLSDIPHAEMQQTKLNVSDLAKQSAVDSVINDTT